MQHKLINILTDFKRNHIRVYRFTQKQHKSISNYQNLHKNSIKLPKTAINNIKLHKTI